MKIIAFIVLAGILLVLGSQVYSFLLRERDVRSDFGEIQAKFDRTKQDQEKLRAELDYYLNPTNLKKELRSRFNLKEPGEKVLILVPRNETTTGQ